MQSEEKVRRHKQSDSNKTFLENNRERGGAINNLCRWNKIKAYIKNKISLLCFCTNSYTKQTYINIFCAIQNIWSWICIQKLSFEDWTFQTSATIKRKTENINFWKVWKDCYSNLTMGTCSVTPPTQSWTLRGHKSCSDRRTCLFLIHLGLL